jgi:hypothetical protein
MLFRRLSPAHGLGMSSPVGTAVPILNVLKYVMFHQACNLLSFDAEKREKGVALLSSVTED